MEFQLKHYDSLSKDELYMLLRLRAEVFVVEQHCPFNDLDLLDKHSHHLLRLDNEKLVAYARIIPPGVLYTEPSIGRVVVPFELRHTGVGRDLMSEAILQTEKLYINHPIKIMAQQYLQGFYESFKFKSASEPFLEDNIWHVNMIREYKVS